MEEVSKKVTELNEQETFQSAMTYEEDQKLILNTEKDISFNEGVEYGIEQGIERGINERNIEIAKSMLKDNVDIETISKYTRLSLEEINNLIV